MFKFLTPTPHVVPHDTAWINGTTTRAGQQKIAAIATVLSATLLLSACQQPTESASIEGSTQTDKQSIEQQRAEENKPAIQSDSATTRIAHFQTLYVSQMQALQRGLQAEYESLQAADSADSDTVSANTSNQVTTQSPSAQTDTVTTDNPKNVNAKTVSDKTANDDMNVDINTSIEVGERDLEVLKSLSLEAREPKLLTENEIIERYQQAMHALYLPNSQSLDAQQADTLLNIATLIPQLFEHAEIAERLTIKSPALGRLIIQHQVWQQIEVQQALEMQQMKQAQQQEFEGLMTKFDETIKGYDEQIAKYEQTLKELTKQ